MADGWRHRYMAPFYALIISFALVLVLGTVLEKNTSAGSKATPTAQEPAGDPATAKPKVVVAGADGFPGEELTIVHGGTQTLVDDLGDLPPLPTDGKYAICGIVDKGWVAVGAIQVPGSDFSCWGQFDVKSAKPSVLRVKRST